MEHRNLWPTTIGFDTFENTDIVTYILTNYDINDPPSEFRGDNLFDDDSKIVTNFKNQVYDKFNKYLKDTIGKEISDYKSYLMKGWITGHDYDYQMTIHNHSGAHLSGAFYVLAEDQRSGGDIVFSDPRTNANRGYDDWFDPLFDKLTHKPKTGDCVIFPSFTYHHVNPYYSNLRIAIPVDLYLYRG